MKLFQRNIMNTTTVELINESEVAGINAWVKGRIVYIELSDFRIIGYPADRFKILKSASDKELNEVKLRLNGKALRWENLDEDITVKGILQGNFQLAI